jgi:hypothetical protein
MKNLNLRRDALELCVAISILARLKLRCQEEAAGARLAILSLTADGPGDRGDGFLATFRRAECRAEAGRAILESAILSLVWDLIYTGQDETLGAELKAASRGVLRGAA